MSLSSRKIDNEEEFSMLITCTQQHNRRVYVHIFIIGDVYTQKQLRLSVRTLLTHICETQSA